jgi:hypothetical protein
MYRIRGAAPHETTDAMNSIALTDPAEQPSPVARVLRGVSRLAAAAWPSSGRRACCSAAELSREYGPVAYRRCLRLLGDRDAAAHVAQEVLLELARDAPRLDDREAAIAHVYDAATRRCLARLGAAPAASDATL